MDSSEGKKKAGRKTRLLEMLGEKGTVTLEEISGQLGISLSTTRRDIEDLIRDGLVRRKAGKVQMVAPPGEEMPYLLRASIGLDEKKRIARAALDLVKSGETIFLAGGSTVLELAQLLPGQRRLTVITHSLRVANLLVDKPGIDLIILGGAVLPDEQTMHSHLTEWAAQQFRANQMFYGVQAISLKHGLTLSRVAEVNTDRAIARMVERIVLLADHTKFEKVAAVSVMPVSDVHIVVTGRELDPAIVSGLEAARVQVIQA